MLRWEKKATEDEPASIAAFGLCTDSARAKLDEEMNSSSPVPVLQPRRYWEASEILHHLNRPLSSYLDFTRRDM